MAQERQSVDLEPADYKAIGKTIARIQAQLDQRRNS